MHRSDRRVNRCVATACAVVLLLLTAPPGMYAGRGDKSGTAGAVELLIPVGARSTALAGASLATVSGIEASYWNPAGMIRSPKPLEMMFSHTTYLADIGVDYFALTDILSDDVALGVHVKSLSFGQIPVTTEDFTDGTGEYTSPTFIVAGASFARRVSDKISVGIGANYVYEQMGKVSASTIAFTGGVQYVGLGGIDGLAVGVVVRNIGPKIQYSGAGLDRVVQVNDALRSDVTTSIEAAPAELPSTIEIALGYALVSEPLGEFHFESSFNNNNFSDDEYKIGVEYAYDHTVFLRGGYSFSSVDEGLEYLFGLSGGVGLRTELSGVDVSIDYAYRSVKYFGGNHIIDVIFGI